MKSWNFYVALLFAKTLSGFLNVTKLSSGTSIIGKYVLKIDKDFLKNSNSFISTKINVTGTNGKTTTSGLISHLIKKKRT